MYKNRSEKFTEYYILSDEDKIKFNEGLRLSDLAKHSGISNFTKPFMIDRRKIKGGGNTSEKLIDCIINQKEDWAMFQFLTEPTYDYEEPKWKEVSPEQRFNLKKTKTYEQDIKILGVFEWLTAFKGSELTRKDLKDILKVNDCQFFCYCPMFHWTSPNFNLSSEFNASVFPTNIAPKHWNKPEYHGDGNALVCKHLDLLLSSMPFFLNPMVSMLNKKLKDRNLL